MAAEVGKAGIIGGTQFEADAIERMSRVGHNGIPNAYAVTLSVSNSPRKELL
jgi:xanthine/CO dehydrogenase XdhC/CoxF family maturation factor